MGRYGDLTGISLEEALSRINGACKVICEEMTVPLGEAYGMITSRDHVSGIDVPSFPRSAMDGYAVKASDTAGACPDSPVPLKVIDEINAGDVSRASYSEGTAVRIMTGAKIPEGYDSVVKQEDTDQGTAEVLIHQEISAYMNYCPVGENMASGDMAVPAGTRIGRIEAGLLAGCGFGEVHVRRPLRVGIVSTGSELTRPGESLAEGRIYNSISYMIASSVRSLGFEVSYDRLCPDEEDVIQDALLEVLKASDMVITTGGVSVGNKDLIHGVLDDIGAHKLFYRVSLSPGSPTVFALYENKPILSLSGNPFAALVNFDLYFHEAAASLMAAPCLGLKREKTIAGAPYEKVNKMRRIIRGRYEGGKAYPVGKKNRSSVFSDMTECNCYMDIPAGHTLGAGDEVEILRFLS